MSIFGVLLLSGILFSFSIILLAEQINHRISDTAQTNQTYAKIQEICQFLQLDNTKKSAGYIALLFGVWNLFGPNFGSLYGGLPIIGALIPSLILCIDAFILNPELLHWMPILPVKEKLESALQRITPIAGWLTLAITVLHSILYRLPFF